MPLSSSLWYLIAFCGLWVAGLVFWILQRVAHVDLKTRFLRHIRYPLMLNRRSWHRYGGWDSITWLEGILILLFVILNTLIIFAPFQDVEWRRIQRRCAFSATVNTIPLYISKSPLVRSLNISRTSQHLFHHWVGRVAIAEAIAHACIVLAHQPRAGDLVTSGYAASSVMVLMLCSSFFFMRRLLGRMFSMLHRLTAVSAAILLLWHVWDLKSLRARWLLGATCAIWLISTLSRLYGLIFRRLTATVVGIEKASSIGMVKVEASLSIPTRIGPGKYFNVFFPGRSRLHGHPITVLWHSPAEKPSRAIDDISLLMSDCAAWARALKKLDMGHKLLLDGPYGQDLELHEFENVFLAAEGIGIAAVLSWALHLAERKNHDNKIRDRIQEIWREQQTLTAREVDARGEERKVLADNKKKLVKERDFLRKKPLFLDATKKVVLFWTLDNNLQMDMVTKELSVLQSLDPLNRFLVVWCGYPNSRSGEPPFKTSQFWRCIEPSPRGFQLETVTHIAEERRRLQGQMIVVASGSPAFTQALRDGILSCPGHLPIAFKETEFRPTGARTRSKQSLTTGLRGKLRKASQRRASTDSGTIELIKRASQDTLYSISLK